MKLKRDSNGNVVCDANGMPIWVLDDGSEVGYDVPGMHRKIGELTNEAKTHRIAKEQAETKLVAFEGIEDPAAAVKAIETLKNLDQKKLIDAGEVEKVKTQVAEGYEAKITKLKEAHTTELASKEAHIYKLEVSNKFATSTFINGDGTNPGKITLPPDIAEATFGSNFKIEDGRVVAYHKGEKIYSKEKPGELADFDEALTVMVDNYPMKDRILTGSGASGTGTQQKQQQRQHKTDEQLTSTQRIARGLAAMS